jgi:hypothetical protein
MLVKIFKFLVNFIKKWGLYGIIGYLTLFLPLGLGLLFKNNELRNAGWIIVAVIATPNGLGIILTIILASLYKWFWKVPLLGFIWWGKETSKKIQIQNQLGLYYDSDEIQLLLDMGKKLKDFSDIEKNKFSTELKKNRLKMIDEKWSKEV